MAKELSTKIPKLTFKNVIGYGCGDAGGVITLYIVTMNMTRYLQVHLAVDPVILAGMLFIWSAWDTINDPLMGTLMDLVFQKAKPGRDKFRPWILASIPVMLFGGIAFYNVPGRLGGGWPMVISLFILKIIYEGGYTMMNIGMGSLLGAMSTNDQERATLSSARGMGSTVGGLIAGIVIPQLISRFGDNATGYGIMAAIMFPLAMVIVFLHYALTQERNKAAMMAEAAQAKSGDQQKTKLSFKDIYGIFIHNRAFLALVLHSISITGVQSLGTGMAAYVYADVLGDIGLQSYANGLSQILQVCLLLLAPILTKKWDLVSIIRVCLISGIVIFSSLLAYVTISPTTNVWIFIISSSVAAGLIIMSVQMQWGLVAEAIDYNEYKTGKRSEGTIYGFFSLSRRIAGTVTGSITVLLIAAIGYNAAASQAGLPQSDFTVQGLETCYIGFQIAAAVLSFLCFTFIWNINDDLRGKIKAWKTGTGPAEYELNK